jgi:hypothetical protein
MVCLQWSQEMSGAVKVMVCMGSSVRNRERFVMR